MQIVTKIAFTHRKRPSNYRHVYKAVHEWNPVEYKWQTESYDAIRQVSLRDHNKIRWMIAKLVSYGIPFLDIELYSRQPEYVTISVRRYDFNNSAALRGNFCAGILTAEERHRPKKRRQHVVS